jgi:peptidyl-prolyl cis-trans isomerase A (cyclophilin A)
MRRLVGLLCFVATAAMGQQGPFVEIETESGVILVALDAERAPLTVANFLRYVDAGLYRDTLFYRVVHLDNDPEKSVKIEVIQGGRGAAADEGGFAPIEHETTRRSGLAHLDGTISMARLDPGTASSEFFICVGAQPSLDYGGARNPDGQGFAAFGQVVEGMDVVRRIHQSKRQGQSLDPAITIVGARRRGSATGREAR